MAGNDWLQQFVDDVVTVGEDDSFNQVSNVEVRATLPSYVKWTNIKTPSSEIFSFNPVTNEVVWDVGSVLSNTGFGSSKKEVQFQLEFLPSTSQVGQAPTPTQAFPYGRPQLPRSLPACAWSTRVPRPAQATADARS